MIVLIPHFSFDPKNKYIIFTIKPHHPRNYESIVYFLHKNDSQPVHPVPPVR